jgi:hypothetical protein
MFPTPHDSWVLARVLADMPVDPFLASMSPEWCSVVKRLTTLDSDARLGAFQTIIGIREDHDRILKSVLDQKPDTDTPPDPIAPTPCYATLEDIASIMSNQPWLWKGWIASGVFNALASDPGIGKTRFALDLARRLWFGLPWPDGQQNPYPAGTRTLWIQGDRNFAEMLQAARDFGLPEEAVVLGSSKDDPTGSLDLDDPATLSAIGDRIVAAGVVLAIIDTVGMTTSRNLAKPEDARDYFAPIIELAQKTSTAILGVTHLSANNNPLGRRIVEKARVVIKMTQPDPEGHRDRRRLWVDKTAIHKPPPLGVTMTDKGNDYDFTPPTEPDPALPKRGPAPVKLEECKRWLTEQLTPNPARVSDLRHAAQSAGFAVATLYDAMRALGVEELTIERHKWWKLRAVGDVGVRPADNSDNPDKPF